MLWMQWMRGINNTNNQLDVIDGVESSMLKRNDNVVSGRDNTEYLPQLNKVCCNQTKSNANLNFNL